jgi:Holliday junction DNA helicase RuvA
VGYEIKVPLTTFYELPEVGSTVALHVHTYVREQALQLYGFQSLQEKALFIHLMSVSGIGPRLAVNILSGIAASELATTVRQGDMARLTSIPGLGRKTAERIVVELRDKLAALELTPEGTAPKRLPTIDPIVEDALSALLNLGYKKAVAQQALEKARKQSQGELTLESLLKESLRSLA